MTVRELSEKNIGVFGVGFHSHKCLYLLNRNNIDPVCFFDNYNKDCFFRGKPVLSPNKDSLSGKYIVVAVSEDKYQSIRRQLLDIGLIEFADFIYYRLINHDMAILYGNCHIGIIKKMLESSIVFSEKYSFYPMPVIMELDMQMVTKEVLDECRLFLGQDIRKENPYGENFATEEIEKKLTKECKILIIPNLFGLGTLYFPQYKKEFNNGNRMVSMYFDGKTDPFGYYPFKDSIIEELYSRGYEKNEIIEISENEKCITRNEMDSCFQSCINKIRTREKKWDIKCSEFIINNYKTHRLFYEPEHPTNYTFEYISNQILQKLGIHDSFYTIDNLGCFEAPIYPVVCKYLGLKFDVSVVRHDNNTRALENKMGLKEYIEEYLWWHKDVIGGNTNRI